MASLENEKKMSKKPQKVNEFRRDNKNPSLDFVHKQIVKVENIVIECLPTYGI